jgi:mannose-6-phosphate isomerase
MGTYPELPSYVLETGENLQDVIDKHPNELFGENVLKRFGHKDLPFLPKVNLDFPSSLQSLKCV